VEFAGHTFDVEADIVVDASGRRAILGRQLGLLDKDPIFDQYAVHAWFKKVNRAILGENLDDIHIYFLPIERGWVWQIPITHEVTSIGVVAEKSEFRKRGSDDVETWFFKQLKSTPDVERAVADAVRINEFKTEGDYSYSMRRFSGENWLLVGDAARFVDPIFSSGVSVALTSGKFASEAILARLRGEDGEKTAFARYEKKLRGGVTIWYEFIKTYYRLLPLFTLFIKRENFRHQILQLLQGEVYDRETVPVLDAMRDFIHAVETNDTHLFRSHLGNIDPIEMEELRHGAAAVVAADAAREQAAAAAAAAKT
jgi:FADH2 O2-dependent halogenase